MGTRTRSREFKTLRTESRSTDGFGATQTGVSLFRGGQTTTDEEHHWHFFRAHNVHKKYPMLDIGGYFNSFNGYVSSNSDHLVMEGWDARLGRKTFYDGYMYPRYGSADFSDQGHQTTLWEAPPASSDSELFAKGGTAISRCAPTVPHASALVSLGELVREGLPSIPGRALRRGLSPSNIGDEYLNYVFGIAPTVSDVKAIVEAARKSERILKQYYRDSGRRVRRGYSFPEEVVTEGPTLISTGTVPWHVPPRGVLSSSTGSVYKTVTYKRRTWFKGAFTYHAEPPKAWYDVLDQLQRANHLFGVGVTPDAVWNLTAWSWLTDWFLNTGDIMRNLSMMQSDGLVMPYGYIMEDLSKTVSYEMRGIRDKTGRPVRVEQSFVSTRKARRKASPFGFGLTFEGFSPRQIAILAALGVTQQGARYEVN